VAVVGGGGGRGGRGAGDTYQRSHWRNRRLTGMAMKCTQETFADTHSAKRRSRCTCSSRGYSNCTLTTSPSLQRTERKLGQATSSSSRCSAPMKSAKNQFLLMSTSPHVPLPHGVVSLPSLWNCLQPTPTPPHTSLRHPVRLPSGSSAVVNGTEDQAAEEV
jgi:hypothetical protein